MSAEFPRHSKDLAGDCVSHPGREDFGGFFKDHGSFHAHCVSHHLEAKSGHRPAPGLRALGLRDVRSKPITKSIGLQFGRVVVTPRRAGSPVSLSLTRGLTAHALAITRPRMRLEPASADPARSLAGHRPQRRPSCPLPRSSGQSPDSAMVGPLTTLAAELAIILASTRPRTTRRRSRCRPRHFDARGRVEGGSFLASRPGSFLASVEVQPDQALAARYIVGRIALLNIRKTAAESVGVSG
jgi:hypothetical protein